VTAGRLSIKRVYILSLGCSRNLVDSEVLQGFLKEKGLTIVDEPLDADLAIVNTCGFIQDAKQESIDMILRLAELKKAGKPEKIVVTGCLSQRYPSELMDEIKEIDGVFGTSDYMRIPVFLDAIASGVKVTEVSSVPCFLYDNSNTRGFLTPEHYAYLKIQEGCSNRCSYCVIPDLRGPLRSRTMDSVIAEAKKIRSEHNKVKELILVAQDITAFGSEKTGSGQLPALLKKLCPVMSDGWIRLLYTHPAHFSRELISVIADEENICKYIDLPIQHINNEILRKMNRRITGEEIKDLIDRLRARMEDVVLRTSVIVGFPGETRSQFAELLDFLKETRFERLGAFIYSPEEGTPAAGFPEQVPEKVKRERFDAIMRLQQNISRENNLKYLGKTLRVLIDEEVSDETGRVIHSAALNPAVYGGDTCEPPQYESLSGTPGLQPGELKGFIGRSYMDAPEVDGDVYVEGQDICVGDFVNVEITGAMEYDLIGVAAR